MAVALSRDLIQRARRSCCTTISTAVCVRRRYWKLARESHYTGYPQRPEELRQWFIADTPGSDLVRYLEGFAHTTAVMQTKDHLERVLRGGARPRARCVVYAEIRFAPELHLEGG